MRFLLRMAFWLAVVLVLLPSGRSEPQGAAQVSASLSASDAMLVASAAASDMGGFCTRKPEACFTGTQILTALGYRAQAGAKMIYDFLSARLGPMEPAPAAAPPAVPPAQTLPVQAKLPQDTLTPHDLEPDWRGHASRKDPRPGRGA